MEGEASSCAMYKNPKEISTRAMTMKRHKKADSLFRAKFGIPDGEIFLDEYHCALQKKILIQVRRRWNPDTSPCRVSIYQPQKGFAEVNISERSKRSEKKRPQGRMYVFEHYVGFYANIFGAQKVKVLPLKDVTAVRKARTIGLPNAIEITHKGKTEFFTSFLVRHLCPGP